LESKPFVVLLAFLFLFLVSAENIYAQEFLFSFGSEGSENGEFNQPFGIAIDSNENIYVGDNFNNRIQKFDKSGSFLKSWGVKGSDKGEFLNINGIAIDSKDNLYVIDGDLNERVQKFTSEGIFVTLWNLRMPGDISFLNPLDIAVDSKDSIYVLENAKNRVQVFDSEGNPITVWGATGSNDGELQNPVRLAIDPSDFLYILEYGNHRIQKFNESGSFLTKWGSFGEGNGEFSKPNGIGVDSKGNVYLLDSTGIKKFNESGSFLTKWGLPGSGNYEFDQPIYLSIGSSDKIYVADAGNNRISVFSQKEIPDLDNDGVKDDNDKCPDESENFNDFRDSDGCEDFWDPFNQQSISFNYPDFDFDGKWDGVDNCWTFYNPEQLPSDENECEKYPVEYDFSIKAIETSQKIPPGENATTLIKIEKESEVASQVRLSCDHDDEVECYLDPEIVWPNDKSILTVKTNNQTKKGNHLVTIISEGGGDKDFTAFNAIVNPMPNQKPTPIISHVTPVIVNKPVIFDATNSFDIDGNVTEWFWDFGGHGNSTEPKATYTFETEGLHPIQLMVKDDKGERESIKEEILVYPTFDPILIIMIGILILVAAIVGVMLISRKRDKKPKKFNIPNPKNSKLR